VGKGSLIGLGPKWDCPSSSPRSKRFLRDRGAVATTYHGTDFPIDPPPTVGGSSRWATRRGMAASHCRGHSSRPVLRVECGRIVQQIFDGRLGLAEGL